MTRAERRAARARFLARRMFVWRRVWRNTDPMPLVFRDTLRPCSCHLCKQARYDRAEMRKLTDE